MKVLLIIYPQDLHDQTGEPVPTNIRSTHAKVIIESMAWDEATIVFHRPGENVKLIRGSDKLDHAGIDLEKFLEENKHFFAKELR